MRNKAKKILEELGMYPYKNRDSFPLEDLIKLSGKYQEEYLLKTKEAEERYDQTGIWDSDEIDTINDIIKYLKSGIIYRERNQRRKIGKNIYGPMP